MTDIVRTAVLGCYGVAGFATPNPWGHVVRRLGLGEPGIRLDLDDLRVDLRIRVAYGLPIAEVARQVESAVRYALGRDLGREPGDVTIRVEGLVQRAGTVPAGLEPGVAGDADPAAAEPAAEDGREPEPDATTGTNAGSSDGPDETPGIAAQLVDAAEPGGGR